MAGPAGHRACFVEIGLPLTEPLHLSEPIQHDRRRDGVQPGRQRRISPEAFQAFECPDEGLLCKIPREIVVPRQAVGQPVDPFHVRVIELALRPSVAGPDTLDQLAFVHRAQAVREIPLAS